MSEINLRLVYLLCGVLLCGASPTYAEQSQLVLDLIQAENKKLSEKINSTSKAKPESESELEPNAELILHALYGVGQRVLAEVQFQGQPYVYLRGQPWPLGDVQGNSQLRLVNITDRCIELARHKQQYSACVSPQGGQP